MNPCLSGTAVRAAELRSGTDNVVVFGLSFAFSLFILESPNTLGMVKSAGCHRFGVLCVKNEQQNSNRHLCEPFKYL